MELDELVATLDGFSTSEYSGRAYRHVAAGRDPLSGEGARLTGGRWNPGGSFAVLYLALELDTAIAEFERLAIKQGRALSDFLPRDLFAYDVRLTRVVDLRVPERGLALGLDEAHMLGEDASRCQQVGEAAHRAGFEGLLAPSATRHGDVLAVFLDRMLAGSHVRDVETERWEEIPGWGHPLSAGAGRPK